MNFKRILFFSLFFSNFCSTYAIIRNYPALLRDYQKSSCRLFDFSPTSFLTDTELQTFLGMALTANYIIRQYPTERHTIYCLGGSPSVLVPCLQFINPKEWQSYTNIAFSGRLTHSLADIPTQYKKQWNSQLRITNYREYLTSIGLDPKTIFSSPKKIVLIDRVSSGGGLFSFLHLLFVWASELFDNTAMESFRKKFIILAFCIEDSTEKLLTSQYPSDITYDCLYFKDLIKQSHLTMPYAAYLAFLAASSHSTGIRFTPEYEYPDWYSLTALTFPLEDKHYRFLKIVQKIFIPIDELSSIKTATSAGPLTSITQAQGDTSTTIKSKKSVLSGYFYTIFGRFFGQSKL